MTLSLQPPAVLLCGPSGTGKTSSLATALRSGLEVFVLSTEPGGPESLLDACERLKLSVNGLHWTSALPTTSGLDALRNMLRNVASMDFEALSKVKNDPGKAAMRDAGMRFLDVISDFRCERTGEAFGSPLSWDDSRLFAIDSLTGWSMIAWKLTVGHKPTASPGEYAIAQSFIYDLLIKIICDRKCFFALTAHVEKEPDELSGIKKLMVSTVGSKLAPKIPPWFSEVVMASRTLDGFFWSTLDTGADLKNRALPVGNKLPPDFSTVISAYRRRKAASTSEPIGPPPPIVVPLTIPAAPMTRKP